MPDQNIGNIGGRSIDLFASKDLGEEEVQVSNGYGPFVMELLLCLAKGENPLDIDFKEQKNN
jgi:hypothetical protein